VTEFGANEHRESEVESTLRFNDDLVQPDEEQLSADEQAAVDALPAGSALLIVKRGPNNGARFLLDQDLTTVGRHPNADIFLDDVTVSRRHAEFKRNGNDFEIVDLASLNGTYFDGARVDQAKLSNGSELQIGKFHLTYFVAKAKP
jgi:pSer/pThr/pTyr-binding forkhead associated (FHA) protein